MKKDGGAGEETRTLTPKAPEPKSGASTNFATPAYWEVSDGVAKGARTLDNRNHNPGLYQLSYSHHWSILLKLTNWRVLEESNLWPTA